MGGNESATKYFQSHGGSAALASKDPKTKYTSNAATKYKEELGRRVAADARQYASFTRVPFQSFTPPRYPDEVVITDTADAEAETGASTPAGEPEDDFFSSWDKPTVKRPSNPPSRTATPAAGNRTASPFLNAPANGNGTARPKSPLASSESATAPAAPRTVSSSAIRKTTTTAAPRKANILGAKKTKLGAKKVTASDGLDFEAAEKKAKEEAERIEKLGYNPDAEAAATENTAKSKAPAAVDTNIVAPTPVSPARAGFGATQGRERSSSEMERLGMGMGRLGFGQVGGNKPAAAAPKKMGFGSTSRAAGQEGM